MSIQAGSLASKSGVLHTNFPLDGSAFEREKFHKQMYVLSALSHTCLLADYDPFLTLRIRDIHGALIFHFCESRSPTLFFGNAARHHYTLDIPSLAVNSPEQTPR